MDPGAAVASVPNKPTVHGSTQHAHHDTPSCKRRKGLNSVVAELVVRLTLGVGDDESIAANGGCTSREMWYIEGNHDDGDGCTHGCAP